MDLAADIGQSAPDLWLPKARRALLGDNRHWPHPRDTPAELKPFVRAFARLRTRIDHQIGGIAVPVQGPVEYELVGAALSALPEWFDQHLEQEAEQCVLLAQFGSDSNMKTTWGDGESTLYWFIRSEDLAAHRFDRTRLIVQV